METREHFFPGVAGEPWVITGHGVGVYSGLTGQGTMIVTHGTETHPDGQLDATGYVQF